MPIDEAKKMRQQAGLAQKSECIQVIVRVRPMNKKEVDSNKNSTITLINPSSDDREADKRFTFDATFDENCLQKEVYDRAAAPIVDNVLEGYNGTVFCYGQTGSGKTHTMEGLAEPKELKGLMPNAFTHLFDAIGVDDKGAEQQKQFLVRASYLELYNEEVRDLLSKDPSQKLDLRENPETGVYVQGLQPFVVKSIAEINHVMQKGKANRSVGSTAMNATSSRSHSIFTIIIEQSEIGPDGTQHIRVGKLNMVDLAGSERADKTHAEGDRLKEGININKSLSTLGNVIKALVDGKSTHVPYRDSKLTRLLQDSLGGNTKTCMIANCGPADYNYEETLSTLRYADRAKKIKNKPSINEDPKDAMLREFQEEIVRLRQELAKKTGKPVIGADGKVIQPTQVQQRTKEVTKVVIKNIGPSEEQIKEIEAKARAENEAKMREIEEKMKKAEEESKAETEEMRQKAERDKKKLLEEKERTRKEREELENKLKAEQEKREKEAKERLELEAKIKQYQAKVVMAGQIQDKAVKQAEELRKAQIEMERKRREKELLDQQLANQEEEKIMIQDKFSSLNEEIEVKTKRLERLVKKYKESKVNLETLQHEVALDKADFVDTIKELNRELKLKQLIIDHFIPQDSLCALESKAIFDETSEEYQLPRLDIAGVKMHNKPVKYDPNSGIIPPSSRKRPESRYSRQDQYNQSPNAIVTPSSYSSSGNTPIDIEEEKEGSRRHRDRPSSNNKYRNDMDGNKYK